MHLEGALRIGLGVGAGRIEHVRITSTRPDAARSLLQGRRRAEIRAALPRLFSVCGRSQAAAGELACAVAAGEPATDAALARCSAEVSAEVVREHAWCVLLDWPRRIGEEPGQDAIAAARAAEASPSRPAGPAEEAAHAVAMAAFGTGADAWLALASSPELDRWIDAGATAAARFLRQTRDDEVAQLAKGGAGASAVPFLDGHDRGALMDELWKRVRENGLPHKGKNFWVYDRVDHMSTCVPQPPGFSNTCPFRCKSMPTTSTSDGTTSSAMSIVVWKQR